MNTFPPPPRGLRGTLSRDPGLRDDSGRASGPFRLRPDAVALPVDAEDVARLVSWAAEHGLPLVPRGAGTGMPGGNVGPGVSLDLRRLDGVQVDPERGTARVEPGLVGTDLDRAAAEHGLFFPAMPSSSERCTLGGMLANNAAGARTFSYGAVRDRVEALDVVLADGTSLTVDGGAPLPSFLAALRDDLETEVPGALEGWPAVRKNSSGYGLDGFVGRKDGTALFAGSEGTLGIITGARVRLAPEPGERAVLLLAVAEVDDLDSVAAVAEEAGAAACEFLGRRFLEIAGLTEHPEVGPLARNAEALVLVELDDARRPVAEGMDRLRRMARERRMATLEAREPSRRRELWAVRHAASPVIARQAEHGKISMQFIEDSVVPRDGLAAYLRGLDEILTAEETDAVMFGHAGDGNVHVNPLVEVGRPDWRSRVGRILEATAELVSSLGGTLAGEHGDGRVRAPYLERVWGGELTAAFRRVKRRLDPAGILNPGVVLPLPEQDPLEGISPEPASR